MIITEKEFVLLSKLPFNIDEELKSKLNLPVLKNKELFLNNGCPTYCDIPCIKILGNIIAYKITY
jgi:hypothetical protein